MHSPGSATASTSVAAPVFERSRHYPELDAVRGIAAFVVVLSHYVRLWEPSTLSHKAHFLIGDVFHAFFNGNSSVILFFLLSGFVLTLPYKRGNELPYGTFVLRRLARIYLPYLGALVLALICDWQLHNPMQVSDWFSKTWTAPLTWPLILQHVLLIGSYNTAQVNTAFWSLAVEMRLSLLFPLLCIPILRWTRPSALIFVLSAVLLRIAIQHLFSHRMGPIHYGNLDDMMLGVLCFAGGILLARWLEPVQTFWSRMSTVQRVLFFMGSVFLLEWLDLIPVPHASMVSGLLTIFGGAGVLVAALCSHRISRVLNHALPAWLGRVSYSLYLVHATVLFALVHLFLGRLTRLELLAPYLIGALAFAAVFYFLVEKPSIHLSRSIGRRGRTLANRPPASSGEPTHV